MTEKELRELDAEVHRVVFGPQPRTWDERYAPHYSTNIAAAWKVVEKLAERFDRDPFICENTYLSGDREWHVVFNGMYEAAEPTAPLAICKAAIAAMRDS